MNVFALLLGVVALVLFVVDFTLYHRTVVSTRGEVYRGLLSLGLAFLTAALLVQFCSRVHSVTF